MRRAFHGVHDFVQGELLNQLLASSLNAAATRAWEQQASQNEESMASEVTHLGPTHPLCSRWDPRRVDSPPRWSGSAVSSAGPPYATAAPRKQARHALSSWETPCGGWEQTARLHVGSYTIVIFYKQCTWGCSGTSRAAPFTHPSP